MNDVIIVTVIAVVFTVAFVAMVYLRSRTKEYGYSQVYKKLLLGLENSAADLGATKKLIVVDQIEVFYDPLPNWRSSTVIVSTPFLTWGIALHIGITDPYGIQTRYRLWADGLFEKVAVDMNDKQRKIIQKGKGEAVSDAELQGLINKLKMLTKANPG